MTVKQLITVLQTYDQNIEVLFRDYDYWYYDVGYIEQKEMNIVDGQDQGEVEPMSKYVILNA